MKLYELFEKDISRDIEQVVKADDTRYLRDEITEMIRAARAIPYEPVCTTSFDGLRLNGRYYAVYHGRDLTPDPNDPGDRRTARICPLTVKDGIITAER